jgi:hypothetical protein
LLGAAAGGIGRAELAAVGESELGVVEGEGLAAVAEAGLDSGVEDNEVEGTVPETF